MSQTLHAAVAGFLLFSLQQDAPVFCYQVNGFYRMISSYPIVGCYHII